MAHIVVREAEFLRTEKERDFVSSEPAPDQASAVFQAPERLLQCPVADRGGADDQRAIGHGFGNGFELFGACEHVRRTDGGARLTKRGLVRIHDAQVAEAEVAHGAGGRADIQRVARRDEHDAQAVELGLSGQRCLF